MRVLLRILLVFCAATSVSAQELMIPNFVGPSMRVPDLEIFPGYRKECGYPIIFEHTLSRAEARITDEGERVIVLDPSFVSPGSNMHRAFLAAHECSHHKLGHTRPEGLQLRRKHGGVLDQELSADCMAGEILKRQGQDAIVDAIAARLFRAGPYSPGGGYPSGIRRSGVLRTCSGVKLGDGGVPIFD